MTPHKFNLNDGDPIKAFLVVFILFSRNLMTPCKIFLIINGRSLCIFNKFSDPMQILQLFLKIMMTPH